MEFDSVTREHIIQGIKDFEEKGYPNEFGPSSTYDIVHEGKAYPPKAIMAYANFHAEGRKIERYFKGGVGTDCFNALERNGFSVSKKRDPIINLIENYKQRIKNTGLKDERYKWELLNVYKGKPNLDADNLWEELKGIDYSNLLYAMSKAVLKHLVTEKPEEIRSLLKQLFDEQIDLKTRIKNYNTETLKLYRSIGETLQHHQDERTIATYLTYRNPDKYTFYKHSFYKAYCKLLGIKQAKKNEKYIHYLELINNLIEDYIVDDVELIDLVKGLIPEYYKGDNHLLLAQDILYQMLEKKDEINYWVFQGNPKIYDLTAALKAQHVSSWKVAAHKDNIKIGDKIILWQTGEESGCYALAEVISNVERMEEDEFEIQYYTNTKEIEATERVKIKITKEFTDRPILKDEVLTDPIFSNFKGGNQGTNFSATEEEYNALLSLGTVNEDNSFEKTRVKLDSTVFNNYITFLRSVIKSLELKPNDPRVVFSVRENSLNFIVGQKYCCNVYNSKNKENFGVISTVRLTDRSTEFSGQSPKTYYNYLNELVLQVDERRTVIDAVGAVLDKTKRSGYSKFNDIDFENYVFEIKSNIIKDKQMTLAKNQIFYGPPGTGKTYALKRELFPLYTTKETSISLDQHFESVVKECSWWEVIAIALLQLGKSKVNDVFNHKWVQKKAELSNSNTVKPTLWGQLQSHTIEECNYVNVKSKQQPLIFNKTEDSSWEILKDKVDNEVPELYELINKVENFNPSPDKEIKRYKFVTFHQSFSYEDFIEGIKPVMSDNTEMSEDLGYKIEDGIFKEICKDAALDPNNRYAIFIDEINRGNVSAIFGELITLIEKDKRRGAINEISIELPYSKKKFSVPSNLDIYGTMNTADRSVEALDTALRRRFEFKEMMPNVDVIEGLEVEEVLLSEVLETINKRIELLVDRDHTIGHSYFVNANTKEKLAHAFNNKIVPLLQEYFYGDYGKIGLVLGKGFVETIKNDKITFADFGYENSEDFKIPSYNLKIIDSENIIDALHQLLNKAVEEN
ncbi:hypothetical protein DMZ43_12165 [Meridianimaribacter sp. CL38]|uniref:EVE domain-containing protein n=1 Tax=Meridianimaribacter sp. CL38 TaxID=2213021 RepID=UPI00103CFE12|nr:EVE domain-containing protein [Meridianimaribacter sp. CL38]TBV25684.1 hypothetical protein DMZ43_12165 [Meridianimaribacter sp. CL38]